MVSIVIAVFLLSQVKSHPGKYPTNPIRRFSFLNQYLEFGPVRKGTTIALLIGLQEQFAQRRIRKHLAQAQFEQWGWGWALALGNPKMQNKLITP